MSMFDPKVGVEIGETIGTVIPLEHMKEMLGGDFLRVRVEIDVSKLLCRGRKTAINANEFIWVAFKYEKLPNFCYWCGRVSHVDKECEMWLASKGKLTQEKQEYGAWLRALPHNPGKISVTTVSGIGDGFGQSSSVNSALTDPQSQPETMEVQNTSDNSMQADDINEVRAAVSKFITPRSSAIMANDADNNYKGQNSTILKFSKLNGQEATEGDTNSEVIHSILEVQTSQNRS